MNCSTCRLFVFLCFDLLDSSTLRAPADPFARSVFLRSLHSRSVLRQRHANAHTLGGTPPPKTPPPGTPPRPPRVGGGPKGGVYTQRKLFRMLKSLKFRKGVKIAQLPVSCRILGVLLSHPCIVEVGPKRPHFCTYKRPAARSGLL